MGNNKIYFLSFVIFTLVISLFISLSDGAYQLINELGWVLKQLPDVKSVEYLDSIKTH